MSKIYYIKIFYTFDHDDFEKTCRPIASLDDKQGWKSTIFFIYQSPECIQELLESEHCPINSTYGLHYLFYEKNLETKTITQSLKTGDELSFDYFRGHLEWKDYKPVKDLLIKLWEGYEE